MFRRIFILIAVLILVFTLTGCQIQNNIKGAEKEKLAVVTTIFPQYDFARQIAGDLADVSLLLPPGVESHAYEPSPADIIKIQNADIFIYTGKEMEAWAQRIVDSIDKSKTLIVDVSRDLTLAKPNEDKENDPHIWTDPIMAKSIVDNINAAFCSADAANIAIYEENALNYKSKLDKLDADIKNVVNGSSHKKLVFGGRFALFHFTNRYNLFYDATFESCGSEAEPSAKTILRLINEIKTENLPVIYYEELSEPKVALSISEQTGAKPLLFHSCHNVTKSEFLQGITYLELMERNVAALKEGLN